MTETTHTHSHTPSPSAPFWKRLDLAWVAILAIPLLVALFDPARFFPTLSFAGLPSFTRAFSSFLLC
ncbi:hypothetical protein [Falsihalocynthiibacter arcticus]|uniref:hypothetical protein n=1 Tax=Falsihalocynthiibacter arcticus TaxID=1579316 RepID=UPI002699DFDC